MHGQNRPSRRRRRGVSLVALTLIGGLVFGAAVASAAPFPAPYFNGFENPGDASGVGDDTMFNVERVASGTNGVTSSAGSWHAEAPVDDFCSSGDCTFTRLGGYGAVFPDGGYTVTVDLYLDMADSTLLSDLRMDWSSAINDPDGNHRRDFVFSIGTDGTGGFAVSASNNAPGWPANPARDPLTITSTGWYTFQHTFYDDGGVLAVDMSVLDSSGTVLKTWTLSDPSDIIGTTVGGNRYAWLVTNDFADQAIDNVTRSGMPMPNTKDDCKKGGWQDLYRADGSTFKNQGDCIQYVNTGK